MLNMFVVTMGLSFNACMIIFKSMVLFSKLLVWGPLRKMGECREHHYISNVSSTLMFQVDLPIHFWGECVLSDVYLINRTPSRLLKYKIPYEILFMKKPNFDELRVFGCLAFAYN